MKKVNLLIGGIILVLAFSAIAFFVLRAPKVPGDDGISLAQAAKMGEMQPRKLLIQIRNTGEQGDLERGDVLLTAPADKEFSPAEIGGFLIIKMDLTDKQAEIITRPWEKIAEKSKTNDDASSQLATEQVKMRKYSVDLNQAGIAPDDFVGREITDKSFDWKIITEKK